MHEHDTRRYFVDPFLEMLGWDMSRAGEIDEESRLETATDKGKPTVRFMDYAGVSRASRAPMLIVEAKAWGVPRVASKAGDPYCPGNECIANGLRHLQGNRGSDGSPLTQAWYEFIVQLRGYVTDLLNKHGKETQCVALTSGSWLVVFKNPKETFVSGLIRANDIFECAFDDYPVYANEIFDLLHRSSFERVAPWLIRASQVETWVNESNIDQVFFGIHLVKKDDGSEFHHLYPNITVFPVIVFQLKGGMVLCVSDGLRASKMQYSNIPSSDDKAGSGGGLSAHFADISTSLSALLGECEGLLEIPLAVADVVHFKGFPRSHHREDIGSSKYVTRPGNVADEWILVTGKRMHSLQEVPAVGACGFHAWGTCRDHLSAIGTGAIASPSLVPRSMFSDGQTHHCANVKLQDKREKRCQIFAIDERTCCQTCVYLPECWSQVELSKLPCGGGLEVTP